MRLIKVLKKSKGFTLIELMIVICVIGILAAVAGPHIVNWMSNYRLKSTARELYSNFQKARTEAVKRNTDVVISFTPGTYQEAGQVGSYQMFVDNGEGGGTADNGSRDGAEPILIQTGMPKNVSLTIASFSGGTTAAGYTPQGLPWRNREGSVTIRNNRSRYYRVTLSYAGNVKLRMSSDGNSWN